MKTEEEIKELIEEREEDIENLERKMEAASNPDIFSLYKGLSTYLSGELRGLKWTLRS